MRTDDVYRKRCKRFNLAGQAHELTFSCYRNQHFLRSNRICQYLAESIIKAREKHAFDLWAYVFMPNHVHLIICPQQSEYSISEILRSIKQPVSRRAIQYLKANNPNGLQSLATGLKRPAYRLWQAGGGYDRNINNDNTLIKTIRYIHNNPVRKELVTQQQDWTYSSERDWSNSGQGPIPLDLDDYPLP